MIKLLKTCEKSYQTFETDCSGFLKDVCKQLGIAMDQGSADSIAGYLDTNWTSLKDHADAKKSVDKERLVVAALKSADSNKDTKPTHGHVAVVVKGELYHKIYPKVYCGGGILGRSKGNKSVGEVWSREDRDSVNYYEAPITPAGLFDEAK